MILAKVNALKPEFVQQPLNKAFKSDKVQDFAKRQAMRVANSMQIIILLRCLAFRRQKVASKKKVVEIICATGSMHTSIVHLLCLDCTAKLPGKP